MLAPDTEAPAEMLFHLPQFRALCSAEDATHTLHNLYTLRGARTRDAKALGVLPQPGDRPVRRGLRRGVRPAPLADVGPGPGRSGSSRRSATPTSTCTTRRCDWPTRARRWSRSPSSSTSPQRSASTGATAATTARSTTTRRPSTTSTWVGSTGTPRRCTRCRPVESSRKYVEYMGGRGAVLERARVDVAAGEYRWAAQVLNHVVFADPTNTPARRAPGRCAGAARVPDRERGLAQLLPDRSTGAAPRGARPGDHRLGRCRHVGGHAGRDAARLPRRPPRRAPRSRGRSCASTWR